ncbi:helix-turn-helix domain-containing protein [Streptomyces tubercidicus]|uniref:nSTAND1 domain-containing NTPase n=1 Tax=Streptomyces tubercidicus TaxID=47759 RepID=UPI00300E2A05
MGRPENPIDPQDGPVPRFAYELRKLRVEAGTPAYRAMARRVGYSAATLSQAAAGERLPTLPVLLAYVRACHGDTEEWQHRWEQTDADLTRQPRPQNDDADPPYRGLARFEPGDAELFFGRDELTAQLAKAVRRHRVSALVGASGSGKSSLLRAGLIPRLRAPDEADGQTPAAVRILTPGLHPMTHGERLQPAPGPGETWLLVDQFEELFTLCTDDAERSAFLDHLLAARHEASRLRVVLAVRADFFGRCADHTALAAALQDATLLVGPMDTHQLRAAIVRPAAARGLIVERDLTARIIEEINGEPGSLPLMSHALMETWRHRQGRTLTTQIYEATGGLHGAIARTAEDTYTQLPPTQATLARRTLLRLITPGDGTQDTRHPINRNELNTNNPADTTAVLEHLTSARLITLDNDTIDLTHEALITAWPRLRQWIEQDRERLRVHRQLTHDTLLWHKLDRDPSALYRGTRLTRAQETFTSPEHNTLNPLETAFLNAALAARDHERHAAARTTRRLRQFTGTLAVLLVLALTAGVIAWDQYRTSEQQRHTAVTAQQMSLSRQLAAQSTALLEDSPDLASLLAVHAYRTARTKEATAGVLAAAGLPLRQRLEHTYDALSAAFSPDGHTLATVDGAGGVRLWNVIRGKIRTTLTDNSGAESVAFSPDGRTLATGEDNGGVRLWDVATGKVRASLTSPQADYVKSVAFSPDGRTVVGSGGTTAKVRLWDTSTGKARTTLLSHSADVKSVMFSPDGHTLATGEDNGRVRLWDTATGKTHTTLAGSSDTRSVAFSPDGRTLATGEDNGRVRLWDTATGKVRASLASPHADGVKSVAISPDGHTLAGGGEDGTVWLWDITTGKPYTTLIGHTGDVRAVIFSPDGRTLASIGDEDGSLRLWDVAGGRNRATLTGHTAAVKSLAFSPGGSTLASGSDDGTVRLWDTTSGTGRTAMSQQNRVQAVAFGPGSRPWAGGSDNRRSMWLWSAATGRIRKPAASGESKGWVVFSPDGRTFAGDNGRNTVLAWDLATGRAHTTLMKDYEPAGPLALSPQGRTLASNTSVGTLLLWDAKTGDVRTTLPGHSGIGETVAFSPDGRTLASGDDTGRVRLWDLTAAQHHVALTGPLIPVASTAFSPDGQTLASGSDDGTLRLWDVKTGRVRATLTGHTHRVGAVAFSPDGRTLASGDASGKARLWDVYLPHPAEAVTKVCHAVNRDLTHQEASLYLPHRSLHRVCRS